ncbi:MULTISPECIES: TonB-dependent receptor [unclassified Sphingobium]|uniref:TonB-dependent receptor n=2 Tax=Sphingobium TaxID=165695 RepID=UPI000D16FC1F|nr:MULTISPECIES: TonB-dependent receptor [unclassified Sphingobium]TWD01172.1 iron complex outermembrane receptor protein [Sphingobium sp. AEW010]TWD19958.1 iron complex outermembrane receptor protein [Sphingobium sp. AEW013]TWD22574.1 iron complex outermembrane receptor protein [Sphingobium sp. AEW001]
MTGKYAGPLLLSAWLLTQPAMAQRTDENAVREAEDGFGKSVGSDSVGIYASGNVRGFSASDAGNNRVEGLYFDKAGQISNVIVRGSTVRVGLTAFGYPFPAPTGIVDADLRRVGDKPVVSVQFNSGDYLGTDLVVDAALPVTEKFDVNLDLGLYDDEYVSGASAWFVSYGGVLRYRPMQGVEATAFVAGYQYGDEEQAPVIYTADGAPPPRIKRRRYFGQDWADWAGDNRNIGGTIKANLDRWQIAMGLFDSRFTRDDYASAYYSGVNAQGMGRSTLLVGRDQSNVSTSGEARLSRTLGSGALVHRLLFSARGRRAEARYGGFDTIDLGDAMIGVPDPQEQPDFVFGERTRDRVQQMNYSAGYEVRWRGVGEFNLGVTRADYRKTVAQPGLPVDLVHDRPWLWNAAIAITPTATTTFYGAMTRGLEESGVAPANAVNRNLALPALHTRQKEIGLRQQLPGGIKLVAALFDLRKPYFDIDSRDGYYRALGDVRHSGLEASLAGQPFAGMNMVIGAVYLRPRVTGQAVDEGRLGREPIGRTNLTIDANLDYRLPNMPALSFDVHMLYEGEKVANAANSATLPAQAVIDLGARYRTRIAGVPTLLRLQAKNVTDVFGWKVSGGGGYTVLPGRRLAAVLTMDL